jgi:Flp pilus assembly protein TadG
MARPAGTIDGKMLGRKAKGVIAMETMFLMPLLVIAGIIGAVSHYVKRFV